ncbi:MAG: archease [Hadesarchaea archaeon]|nr:archease [Hadesarchaea archaeon]
MKDFEWIDHPSDIGFRAYGEDLCEAFENAALALAEVIVDSEKVELKGEVSVELEAEDKEALLYDWLEYFLYLYGANGMIASKFEVSEIKEERDSIKLSARAWGEEFDSDRHEPRSEVKAITYHMMEINCSEEGCSVQVVVDI